MLTLTALAHPLRAGSPVPGHMESLMIDSLERRFSFHVPENLKPHPKLLFVLHASAMTARGMEAVTGRLFDSLADANKDFIVVYPQGYHGYWDDCRKSATYEAKTQNIKDTEFFSRMISYFSQQYGIDTGRVFAMGYSNGAQMCFRLAEEKPGMFRGLAAVSANLPVETNNSCIESGKPVSMLIMNGTSDPLNPYNGGTFGDEDRDHRGAVLSTDQTLHYWLGLSRCDTNSMTTFNFPDVDKEDNSTAVKYDYSCPSTGKDIVLVKILNGGHLVPNPDFNSWPKSLGNVNGDINAPVIIWDYFSGLSRLK